MNEKERFEALAESNSEAEICSLYIDALNELEKGKAALPQYEMNIFHPTALDMLKSAHVSPELVDIIEETLFLEDVIELCSEEKFLSVVRHIKSKMLLYRDYSIHHEN